jgi:hypothetical protein
MRRPQPRKRARLDILAASMRKYHLTHGSGCKGREKAILKRTQERRMNQWTQN